jgi:hypothetical protein
MPQGRFLLTAKGQRGKGRRGWKKVGVEEIGCDEAWQRLVAKE